MCFACCWGLHDCYTTITPMVIAIMVGVPENLNAEVGRNSMNREPEYVVSVLPLPLVSSVTLNMSTNISEIQFLLKG